MQLITHYNNDNNKNNNINYKDLGKLDVFKNLGVASRLSRTLVTQLR